MLCNDMIVGNLELTRFGLSLPNYQKVLFLPKISISYLSLQTALIGLIVTESFLLILEGVVFEKIICLDLGIDNVFNIGSLR